MNFFKKLLKGSGPAESTSASEARASVGRAPAEAEPFDYELRIVHLPQGGAAKVWKTRTVKADHDYIYALPPLDWEGKMPTAEPLSLYLMTDARTTEFDSILKPIREGSQVLLRINRPTDLEWKSKEGSNSASQKRKFLRIDVSLPTHISVVVPTLSGSGLKVDEAHEARMIDLSLEGCSIVSDYSPPVDRLIEVKVLGPVFPLVVQGKVIRVKPSPIPNFKHNAAVVFQNLSQVTRDMIGSYILERQKEKP